MDGIAEKIKQIEDQENIFLTLRYKTTEAQQYIMFKCKRLKCHYRVKFSPLSKEICEDNTQKWYYLSQKSSKYDHTHEQLSDREFRFLKLLQEFQQNTFEFLSNFFEKYPLSRYKSPAYLLKYIQKVTGRDLLKFDEALDKKQSKRVKKKFDNIINSLRRQEKEEQHDQKSINNIDQKTIIELDYQDDEEEEEIEHIDDCQVEQEGSDHQSSSIYTINMPLKEQCIEVEESEYENQQEEISDDIQNEDGYNNDYNNEEEEEIYLEQDENIQQKKINHNRINDQNNLIRVQDQKIKKQQQQKKRELLTYHTQQLNQCCQYKQNANKNLNYQKKYQLNNNKNLEQKIFKQIIGKCKEESQDDKKSKLFSSQKKTQTQETEKQTYIQKQRQVKGFNRKQQTSNNQSKVQSQENIKTPEQQQQYSKKANWYFLHEEQSKVNENAGGEHLELEYSNLDQQSKYQQQQIYQNYPEFNFLSSNTPEKQQPQEPKLEVVSSFNCGKIEETPIQQHQLQKTEISASQQKEKNQTMMELIRPQQIFIDLDSDSKQLNNGFFSNWESSQKKEPVINLEQSLVQQRFFLGNNMALPTFSPCSQFNTSLPSQLHSSWISTEINQIQNLSSSPKKPITIISNNIPNYDIKSLNEIEQENQYQVNQ